MLALFTLLAVLHLTGKANHKTFTVKPKTTIVVTLKSTPSTGYHWTYKPSYKGSKVVKLVSQRYVPPKHPRPGAAGKEVWHFRAKAKGVMYMAFRYVQSLMSAPTKKVDIGIHVR
jgi:predicted secreted protein